MSENNTSCDTTSMPPKERRKSSIAVLQEYCYKKKLVLPFYEFLDSPQNIFRCRVTVVDIETIGYGRSKQIAKFHAAAKAIELLRSKNVEINFDMKIPSVQTEQSIGLDEFPVHTRDMVKVLRDYCAKNNHPIPIFELANEVKSKECPSYTWCCKIASIKRFGTASNKKEARQKAATEVLNAIMDSQSDDSFALFFENMSMDDEPSTSRIAEQEDRNEKFKLFHDLNKNKADLKGVSLSERHNFFTKFPQALKNAARKVLCTEYSNDEEKAMDVFKALQLKPKITRSKPVSNRKYDMLFIELDCEYDCAFANLENKIYKEIVDYFRVMIED